MKPLVDGWRGYDDWLTKDLPTDEPPLTPQERALDEDWAHEQNMLERMFR
jgi:hypothetical protein